MTGREASKGVEISLREGEKKMEMKNKKRKKEGSAKRICCELEFV